MASPGWNISPSVRFLWNFGFVKFRGVRAKNKSVPLTSRAPVRSNRWLDSIVPGRAALSMFCLSLAQEAVEVLCELTPDRLRLFEGLHVGR